MWAWRDGGWWPGIQTKLISVTRAQSSCRLTAARRVNGGLGVFVDEGVVNIYLSLTTPAERSTWGWGGWWCVNSSVWCGLSLAMYTVIIMIIHVGGGRCFCCHIGLGAVDPNHDLPASPWWLSTVCRMLSMGKCLDICIICYLITALWKHGRRLNYYVPIEKKPIESKRKVVYGRKFDSRRIDSLHHLEVLLQLDCPMDRTWFGQTHTPVYVRSHSSVCNTYKVECCINLHQRIFMTPLISYGEGMI